MDEIIVQVVAVVVPQEHISKFEIEDHQLNRKHFNDIKKLFVEKFEGVSVSLTKKESKKEITIKGTEDLVAKT